MTKNLRIMFKYLILFSTIIIFSTSCLVTKKKYDALESQMKKSVDSLENIEANFKNNYEKMRYTYQGDAKYKQFIIDSIQNEVKKLSGDTSKLKKSLKNAIFEYNNQKSKLSSYQKKLNKFENKLNAKNKITDSLTNSLRDKEKRLSELEQMIKRNKDEANKLKKVINDALNSFDKSELNVYLKDGKVYVAMEEKLMFKSGSSRIDKRGKEAIIKLSKILEKNTDTEILIEGHTDNVGKDKYNWKLSSDRALSIVNILLKNSNIAPKRITASGRGMYSPIASNDTKEGRKKNRRIEIILAPKLNSLYEIMNK